MPSEISKCKITVVKRTINQDLIDEYIEDRYRDHIGLCQIFKDNQEFLLKDENAFSQPPADFCATAWADIRKDILTIAYGANVPGIKYLGTVISSCTDWFRPVLFKIERIE